MGSYMFIRERSEDESLANLVRLVRRISAVAVGVCCTSMAFFFSSRRRRTRFLPVSWARSVYKRQD